MFDFSRRRFLASASAASALGCSGVALGQDVSDSAKEWITPETQRGIDRGLSWLSKRQVTNGRNIGAFGHGGYEGGVAVCGLSGLAFMCGGGPPRGGEDGKKGGKRPHFLLGWVGGNGSIAP